VVGLQNHFRTFGLGFCRACSSGRAAGGLPFSANRRFRLSPKLGMPKSKKGAQRWCVRTLEDPNMLA